jgi:hypothetical protein
MYLPYLMFANDSEKLVVRNEGCESCNAPPAARLPCCLLIAKPAMRSAIGTTPQLAQKLIFCNSDLDHCLGQGATKAMVGGCLIGVYLTGVHLMGVHLMVVYLIYVHLMNVHLTGVCLMGMYLIYESSLRAGHGWRESLYRHQVLKLLIVGDSAVRLLITLGARSAW